jgi:amino acid adenylation domain-containing protein
VTPSSPAAPPDHASADTPSTIPPGAPAPALDAELPLALAAGGGAAALAAFALLLSRLGGDDEVEVLVRAADGERALRLDVSGNPSASAFTAGVARALAGNADAPEAAPSAGAAPYAFTADALETGIGIALRVEGGGTGALRFDPERVGPHAALRLAARFQVVAGAMEAAPDAGIAALPVLTPGERAERVRWNATDADLPHGVLLHQAFEARADANPHAVAIVYGGEETTYGALEADANRLARHLRGLGVGPESRVGICVERGPRVLAAILGVLKAGGAYVPLDAAYPPERLAQMVGTAAVRVLVTEAALAPRFPGAARTVLLDGDADAIAAEDAGRPDGGAAPENLAYVIFTSGSTGEPKGIALAHRGVMNNLADLNARHGVGPADRVLLLSSLSFDMSVYETLGILAAGGAVVIPRADELRDPVAWAALCRRHGVTLWNSAPALLGMLCEHAEAHPYDAPSGLRLAFLGGDWVPVPLVDRVRAWAPAMRDFIVMGGATEASIHSIIYPVGAVDPAWRSIPYGVPMANQHAWVLDRHLRQLPAGVAGELFLGGIGLARGYTGRPGLTAERFLPNAHGEAGARLYRTGDLARYGDDGTIELLGRIDHQLKIRGLRIEPGEIETALRRHPAVQRAVVVARADGGERRLVAYLVPAEGAALPGAGELRELLRRTLPDYMVPAAYVALERLPLSPNGKVDRARLPAPPEQAERAPFVAPRTPAEAALAQIWGEVLGADQVGAHDDFFALGGQSLAAARVAARVRERLGVQLALGEFFRVPTLSDLAAAVELAAGPAHAGDAPIPRVEGDGPFPLSFAQERLWFLDRLQPDSAFYNIATALRIRGALDAAALERALGEVARRHEALRTRFVETGGAPVQRIEPFAGFTLPAADLTGGGADEVRLRARAEASRPFDLAAGPPFRAALLRTAHDEHLLVVTMHHVVGDGWSTGILLRELAALYGAFAAGREPSPAPPAARYADYAAWQREQLRGDEVERQLAYWRERLSGAPEIIDLPADHPRPAVQSYRGGRERLELSPALAARLRGLARREGVSLYMVLLGAFQVLLSRWGAGDDVVVGSPVAGRTHPAVEGTVGFFANTLALRTDLSGDPAFGEVLRRVRAAAVGALEHQDVPFERLVQALRPARSLGHSPLAQVLFALQENDRAPALPGLDVEEVDVDLDTSRSDLVLQVTPRGGVLRCEAEYALDLFEPGTIRRMLRRLERVLEQVADDAETPVSRIELLDGDERRLVVEAWNRTDAEYPRDASIPALFAEQAAAAPAAAAVVCGDAAVTYGELDARANRLARHLRRLGVGVETRVGICLERGVDAIVAVLGVLKAGGAYVPLDPGYPAVRLSFMLADAGVAVLVTRDGLRDGLAKRDGVAVVSVDGAAERIAAESAEPLRGEALAGSLAYVMYTSGSTGTPRGVGVEHRSVVRLVRGARYAALGPDEVMLHAAPVSFDASTLEIWGALLNGGRLAVVPQATPTLAELGGAIVRHGVTTLWLTAGLFSAMVDERLDDLRGVRQLLAGGDVLPADAARRVVERFPACRLINGYGPTENTTFTCCHTVPPGWSGARVPIGVPVSNTRVYVLDRALRPVSVGVPGELYAGGDGVARGYLGRPALTAERFVPDPFSGRPGARLYRTGDMVRWTDVRDRGGEPHLEFRGRIDQQVKLRGFRIEPGEVEAALRRVAGVADCAVAVRDDVPGGRLVAYVVGGAEPDTLRAALRATLPEYMVPAAFVSIDRVPLTANGKLDRRALPDPEAAAADDAYVAPRTRVEEALAEIWAEVLRRDRVSVTDDFFALGGHSLLATRVVSRVRQALGVELPLAVLFEAGTVQALAAAVEARGGGAGAAPIPRAAGDGPFPLAPAQRRLWLWEQVNAGAAAYNVPLALRLSGPLDAAVLERALDALVRRHEALRTVFDAVDGEPVQRILPESPFPLPVEPLPGDDAGLRRRLAAEAARPFDLAAGPLFRALLLAGEGEHVLLVTFHHIVCDGWSTGILLRELSALYDAFARGEASPLAAPALRYADYALWHGARVAAVEDEQLAGWRAHLAGAPGVLELPADRPRPAVQTHRGAQRPVRLPGELVERARALGRDEGATLHMVLLAALYAVLARHARAGQVVVGSAPAGRTHPDTEALVGFFVNTLPIRADLSADPGFRAFLPQVRAATLEAYDRQDVPFDRLVEVLAPGGGRGHAPLVQVAFTFQEAPARGLRLGAATAEPVPVDAGTAQFDLTLALEEDEAGVAGMLEYATDLFDAATAERMATRLRVLLESALAAPDAPISRLPLLNAGERETIAEWSGAGERVPVSGALHHRFEARAAARPQAVALTFDGRSSTYGELNARANRLARRLRALGAGPESRVGLCAERSPDLVVGVLAILKAGAAYVPLDPAYPAERLAYMAEDSGIRILLAQPGVRDRVPAEGIEVLSLDDIAADELPNDPGVEVRADNLAYVIYTSGSTGRPKGVGVTHGNVLRLFDATQPSFAFGEGDVWTLFHSYAFDFSVWELWGALLYGGRLVVVPWAVSRDPAAFRALLARERVTVLNQTPSAFRALAEADAGEAEPLQALRTVVFGGEALRYESLRGWLDRYGPKRPRLVNMYGITETTVHVTWHTVTGRELREAGAGSGVGRAIPDLRAYVLDPAGNPSPVGIPGELHVGGAGLARGYLGRPALTAERFVPDPFTGDAGARLYRSGDLARWKPDGTLEYLGRIDQQVKIRGFRIELGEIEAALLAHPSVAAAAVVVRGDGEGAALAAYVVPAGEAAPSASELRDALTRRLPEYMVPAAIVCIDRIPLTANGKLDRGALPEPDEAGAAADDAYVAPRTPVEEVLAGIWADVLRRDRVGAADDFFALGGHSLLATRVVARMRQVLGVELSLRALFEASTVQALAARVDALRQTAEPRLAPIVPADRSGALALSFAQERMWFLQRMQPESAFYNITAVVRLSGALHVAALERALGEVVRRHESLRTVFREADGAPVQVIAPFGGFALPVEDVGDADDADRRAADEAARPFDLAAGPLFRPVLLRVDADEHVLLLSIHHIVTDEWGLEVLFRELAAAYAAFRDGGDPALPALPVQYADFAAWQRDHLRGEVLEQRLGWWRERLAGAPALLELPTDHPRPAVQSYRGDSVHAALPVELRARLEALGRREGATLYMVVLAAFQALLARYTGADDVVVGSPVAGQTRREVQDLIGFFTNTLVLRTDLSGDPSFAEALRRVREGSLGAWQHQDVPFERLVAELQPGRSLAHAPLFQVFFVLQDADRSAAELPGVRMRRGYAGTPTSKYDLTLSIAPGDDALHASIEYATDLFERATIERMMGHVRRVLEQVCDDPDTRLSALELLDGDERRRVVEEWNRTDAPYPADACIHDLFQAQAARTPDAPAVVCEAESLTYGELNARANRIAHHLRSLGVGPEARVGVCLRRGTEMVAALLGVLKAGGAYVPLDPAYPVERLAFTLADSGVCALVTQDALRGLLPVAAGVAVVALDGAAAEIARERADDPAPAADPRGLAYLIYTSGSTGTPKGVAIEHASAVALLTWAAGLHDADELSGMLAATSICFDLSVYELFLPLSRGGRVIVVENALALMESTAADQVRLINTVPSAIAALLGKGGIPAGVTTVNLAGEPLRPALVDALYAAGIRRVHDLYGPSEDTTYSTWTLRRAGGPATIGGPIHNTRAYVLGAGMHPVPAGVVGELYLGGRGLARGYLGRPGLTAERFVPDPFAAEAGGRLYRTGDRARWLADGTLEFLGRLDGQVKVRGYRIELGEVEAALRRQPGVDDCVAVVRTDEGGDRRLVAYVAGTARPDALREALRRMLPEYMVPSALVPLERLPLTPNGKVDRKALPEPDAAGGVEGDAYVPPRTPVEEVLAGIWAQVLRRDRVGAADDFFAIGGHSLLATRVVARIPELFGVELSVAAVFQAPTVAELADRVEALLRAGEPRLAPVVPADRSGPLPLSFAQERLWFLQRMQPESAFYNITAVVRLSGALHVPALERALGEIVRRHESLRTVFREADGAPVQVIAPFGGFALPVEVVGDADDADRRAADEAARPFDLAAGPLFRPVLLRVDAEEHVLLLSIHHIVTDEWGLEVLFRELAAAYAAFRDGGDPALPALPVQYADFAAWQRDHLRGEVLEQRLGWWRERLAGAPALLELPTDHPRPAVQSYRGDSVHAALPVELRARLEALGRREGATLYMVVLAAFQALLARYTGADDVVVGSPVAGQTRREVQDLIGFFTNTLVLRTDLSGDPSFAQVVRRVREGSLGAWQHQDVPFERLVAELQPGRSLAHAPLFQVFFVLQDADRSAAELPGVRMRRGYAGTGTSKYDLTLAIAPGDDGIGVTLEYATDLFERATVERMMGHVRRVLEQVAADGDVRLSTLELVGEDERRLVVEGWNRTDAAYPADACIHPLIEAQAERTPDAQAVVFEAEALTFRQLNERANRLAHHLIGLGVGTDTPVGLCLERGVETIVAVLAVLKAGGACVPLDPAYPAPRLAYMAASAALPVLITQPALRASLPPLEGVRIVAVDEGAAESAGNPAPRALPDSLAYLLYTSGSTGTPKGVGMPHRALVNLVAWHRADALLSAPRRTLQFASLSFDVSFQEIAVTLAAGGTLVLVDDELRRDPHRLLGYLAGHRVERLFLPFVALQALAEAAREGAPAAALREVVTAGEQLACTPQIAAWIAGMPGCRLVNHYGPTETHVATAYTLSAGPGGWDALPPIGAPVANTRTYVLDARLAPVPVGVPGELYLAGVQVARGYRGRPALTAERFVPDPFSGSGGRMYRTGDRARWKADGVLEYLGRADQQVKIRGFRVEPGEVEAALRRHPGVTDCAVVAREDAPGTRRLVAYVAGGADPAALRAHLRDALPEYMVPAAFVALERLPLTPSGKLDRRALPAPELGAGEDGYVAPRTAEEAALAAIWAELLRVERVGVHDSFFELGGHSLLATRVVSRVRRELGVELPLRALFEAPTLEALAARLAGGASFAPAAGSDLSAFAAESPQSLLGALDGLSDEAIDRLLAGHS